MTERLAEASAPGPGPSGSSMRAVARGSTANLAGGAVTAIVNFGITIAVTRTLDKPSAGVFFSVTSLFLLATSIGQLGTDTGLVYFISRCRALRNTADIRSYMRTAMRPVLAVGILVGLGMFVFTPQIAELTNRAHSAEAIGYLRVLAVFIPIAGLESVAISATTGLGTMRPSALIEQITRPALQIVLTLTMLAVLPRGGWIGLAWSLPYLLAAGAAWWSWRRRCAAIDHNIVDRGHRPAREFWRFTGPRTFASVLQTAMQRFDIVLVGGLAGPAMAAVYAASTRFVVVGQVGGNAISRAVRPQLGTALARQDHLASAHLYRVATAWLIAVTWPLYLTFLVFGVRLLAIFGHGYAAGRSVLIILSIAMMVSTGCGMVDVVLNMAGRTSWNLINVGIACATNLGLDLWLIPSHGVLGAAIGWGVAIVLQNIVPLTQVGLALRLHPFGSATATSAGLAVICFGAWPLVLRLALGTTWAGAVIGVTVGAALYLAGLWRFRETLELSALRAIRRRNHVRPKEFT